MRSILFFLLLLADYSHANEDKLVLTETSIGQMNLVEGMEISLYKLSQQFPGYVVTQRIGHGDSPDFFSFEVSTWEGEEVIAFISFINEEEQGGYEKSIVKLDEVISCSNKVIDSYGVSPGKKFNEIYETRKEMVYGFGHMDNFLGKRKLWYLFSVPNGQFTQGSIEIAKKTNPEIECLSWPYPRWL